MTDPAPDNGTRSRTGSYRCTACGATTTTDDDPCERCGGEEFETIYRW